MFEIKNMPMLPGEASGRAVNRVSAEDLKTVGVSNTAFALRKGDIIEFSINDDGAPVVISQPIRNDENSPVVYYVAVKRNGKDSWLGISSLTKKDATGKATCQFCEDMQKYPSFLEMFIDLKDKKIKCTELVKKSFAHFDNGVRVEGKFDERFTPQIAWA